MISDSHKTPLGSSVLFPFCDEETGPESISDLPQFTQPGQKQCWESNPALTNLRDFLPPTPTPTLFPSVSYPLPHVHSSLTLPTHCVPHTGWVPFGQAVLTGSAHLPGKGRVSAGRSFPASGLRPRAAVSLAAVPGASRQLFLGCSKLGMLSSGKTRKQKG